MFTVKKIYKFIQPKSHPFGTVDNQDVSGNIGLYGNYTWFHRLVQGSASRMTRYREYDLMDNDVDVSRALDIIAEEITGNSSKSELPMLIKITAENEQMVKTSTVVTLKAALKTWCKIQEWHTRLFKTVRNAVKYGDCFFLRPVKKYEKFMAVLPKNVISALVAEDDATNVLAWQIKTDFKRAQGMPGINADLAFTGSGDPNGMYIGTFLNDNVIRFTFNDELSEEAPFGESILRAIYRTFKQKELLEDALLIYRIQRAPERRVFYIDVGKMPPNRVKAHLEQIKSEFRQKKIPTPYGGKNNIESIYDPQSMNEDFFFARRPDGSGSAVETLPSGQNLGELQDLDYFLNKLWRGLRIPKSYMDASSESSFTDGKVGIAYMQEIRFTLFIERLQKNIEATLDAEFKRFLRDQGINIDPTIFNVCLPEPSNFSKSRQQQMDSELLNNYNNLKDDKMLSPRFIMKRYLMLSEEEILMNIRMKLEEMGIDPDKAKKSDLMKIFNPELAESGGYDGGLGAPSGGSLDLPIDMDTSSNAGTPEETGEETGEEGGEDVENQIGGNEETAPEVERGSEPVEINKSPQQNKI